MQIDIIGGSYQQKYNAFNSERTINWFPTITCNNEKNKNKTALWPTAGLTQFCTIPGRYFRCLYTSRTPAGIRTFAIVDNSLYEVFINGSYSLIAVLTNLNIGASSVDCTVNELNQVGFFHQSASFVFDLDTNTLTEITTDQFPGVVSSVDYMAGYTIISSEGAVYYTLGDMLTWDSLNTFTPNYTAAPTIAVKTLVNQLYTFSTRNIDTYVATGDSLTPFQLLPKSSIQIGLVSKDSLYKFQDGFIFVGRAESGECAVYLYDKYSACQQISTFSITWRLNLVKETLAEAYCNAYATKDGHVWYQLTVPSLNTTFVYDYSTQQWFERQSKTPFNDSDGLDNYREFRGKKYTNFNGINLFGDLYSGKIYEEDFNNFTEDDETIIRTRISSTFDQERQDISVDSVELDTNCGYGVSQGQGSNPVMMASWSNDGGYNYTDVSTIPLGAQGNHANRARLNHLGSNRLWTFKITLSDPIDSMVQNCIAHGSVGDDN